MPSTPVSCVVMMVQEALLIPHIVPSFLTFIKDWGISVALTCRTVPNRGNVGGPGGSFWLLSFSFHEKKYATRLTQTARRMETVTPSSIVTNTLNTGSVLYAATVRYAQSARWVCPLIVCYIWTRESKVQHLQSRHKIV